MKKLTVAFRTSAKAPNKNDSLSENSFECLFYVRNLISHAVCPIVLFPKEYSCHKQEGSKPYSTQNTCRTNRSPPVETLERNNIKEEIKTISKNENGEYKRI
jgi:hypothetical protein